MPPMVAAAIAGALVRSPRGGKNSDEDAAVSDNGARAQEAITAKEQQWIKDATNPRSTFMEQMQQELQTPNPKSVVTDGHWLVDGAVMKFTIMGLVLVNALLMGVEADHPELKAEWDAIAHVFGAAFFIEMILKISILRTAYFKDMWNLLDCVLAVLGFLDTWFMTILQMDELGLQQFSILRLLRLLRLVRLARIFKHLGRLVVVMKSIFDAIENTFWVTCVLTICIYVCAIFCVDFIGRPPPDVYPGFSKIEDEIDRQEIMLNFNPHIVFGSMSAAMLTLFNIAIFAEWTEIVRPVLLKQPFLVLFFLFFAVFVCFGVMNVLIGMIVESAIGNARAFDADNEAADRNDKVRVLEQLRHLIFSMDGDGDMSVDMNELHKCMHEDPAMKSIMTRVDLPHGLSAKELLAMLDNDGDGKLECDEFIQAFYRLIHCGGFQQVCLLQMGVNEIKHAIHDFRIVSSGHMSDVTNILKGISEQLGRGVLRKNGCGCNSKDEELPVGDSLPKCRAALDFSDPLLGQPPRPEQMHTCLERVSREVGALVQQKIHEELVASLDNMLASVRVDGAHDCLYSGMPSPQTHPGPISAPGACGESVDHMVQSELAANGSDLKPPPELDMAEALLIEAELAKRGQELGAPAESPAYQNASVHVAIGTNGVGASGNSGNAYGSPQCLPPHQLDV